MSARNVLETWNDLTNVCLENFMKWWQHCIGVNSEVIWTVETCRWHDSKWVIGGCRWSTDAVALIMINQVNMIPQNMCFPIIYALIRHSPLIASQLRKCSISPQVNRGGAITTAPCIMHNAYCHEDIHCHGSCRWVCVISKMQRNERQPNIMK